MYSFIFGCAGSSLLWAFFSCSEWELLSSCHEEASHCGSFSCWGAQAPECMVFSGCGLWTLAAAAAARSLQSCPTLCNPIEGSPPGSPVPGILQARTLEWLAISFSNAWKWKVKKKLHSRVWPLTTPWTVAYQAPPSMGVSRQEYWSGVPLPSPVKHTKWPNYECKPRLV